MSTKSKLIATVKSIIERRGKNAMAEAMQEIALLECKGGIIASALKYFAEVTLHGALPVFPTLISLSCEAAGGKSEKTTSIGGALTLIALAADVHDDIIDKSTKKYAKKTVVGKFGPDVGLLMGNVLLFHGLTLLHRECETLSKNQKDSIIAFCSEAFLEISNAEARETKMRKNCDVTHQEYYELIRSKAAVPEMHCKVGGILANADSTTVEALGHYGRTFGIASIMRDEFIDLLEYEELKNRLRNECLPYPALYALQNPKIANQMKSFLGKTPNREEVAKMVDLVIGSKEVCELKKNWDIMIKTEVAQLAFVEKKVACELASLLEVTRTDL